MPIYFIPAKDGKIDKEVAKVIAEKCVYRRGRTVKSHIKRWVIHTDFVEIETDIEIKELEEFKG